MNVYLKIKPQKKQIEIKFNLLLVYHCNTINYKGFTNYSVY
jgi:hypothetical protein